MTRTALFAVVTAGLTADPAAAAPPTAPPPRPTQAARPRGPAAPPAETIERIIKNSQAAADRLAGRDTGSGTQKLQDETLALIDSLLDRESPTQSNASPNPNPHPGSAPKPADGQQSNAPDAPVPEAGRQPTSEGKKDAETGGKVTKKPVNTGPMPTAGPVKDEPQPGVVAGPTPGGAQRPQTGRKPDPAAAVAGARAVPPSRPAVPLDEEVVKQVWGHLKEKERQQAIQWLSEKYMPRYAELMHLYFSSLGDRRPVAETRK